MRIGVKVQPKASRQQVVKGPGEKLKVCLKASPVDGKANSELVCILAKYFNVSKSCVRIITGKQSRNKVIEVISAN